LCLACNVYGLSNKKIVLKKAKDTTPFLKENEDSTAKFSLNVLVEGAIQKEVHPC